MSPSQSSFQLGGREGSLAPPTLLGSWFQALKETVMGFPPKHYLFPEPLPVFQYFLGPCAPLLLWYVPYWSFATMVACSLQSFANLFVVEYTFKSTQDITLSSQDHHLPRCLLPLTFPSSVCKHASPTESLKVCPTNTNTF